MPVARAGVVIVLVGLLLWGLVEKVGIGGERAYFGGCHGARGLMGGYIVDCGG